MTQKFALVDGVRMPLEEALALNAQREQEAQTASSASNTEDTPADSNPASEPEKDATLDSVPAAPAPVVPSAKAEKKKGGRPALTDEQKAAAKEAKKLAKAQAKAGSVL